MQKQVSSENSVNTEFQSCPPQTSQNLNYSYYGYVNQSGLNHPYYANQSYANYYSYYQSYMNASNTSSMNQLSVSNPMSYSNEQLMAPRISYQSYNPSGNTVNYGMGYLDYNAQNYNCYSYWPTSYTSVMTNQIASTNTVTSVNEQIQFTTSSIPPPSYSQTPTFPATSSNASVVPQFPDIPLPETTTTTTSAAASTANRPPIKEVKFRIRPRKQSRFSSPIVSQTAVITDQPGNDNVISAPQQMSENNSIAQNAKRSGETFSLFQVDEWPQDLKDYCTKVYQSCSSSPAKIERAYNFLIKEIEEAYNQGNMTKIKWSEKPIPIFSTENLKINPVLEKTADGCFRSVSGCQLANESAAASSLRHQCSYSKETFAWKKKSKTGNQLNREIYKEANNESSTTMSKSKSDKEFDYTSTTDEDSKSKDSERSRKVQRSYNKQTERGVSSNAKRKVEQDEEDHRKRLYNRKNVGNSRRKNMNRGEYRANCNALRNVNGRNKDFRFTSGKFGRKEINNASADMSVNSKGETNCDKQLQAGNSDTISRYASMKFKKEPRFRKNLRGWGKRLAANRFPDNVNNDDILLPQCNVQSSVSNVSSLTVNTSAQKEVKLDSQIVGTCTELEKPFLRLTSEPEPGNIRPLCVLIHAFDFVSSKAAMKNDLHYFCDQLRSIRQDLTVQNIRNQFTVKVYEANATAALKLGDREEFNQCQTQLISLYKEGLDSENKLQFMGYRLIYYMLINDLRNIEVTLNEINATDNENTLSDYLELRKSWSTGNFFRLFSCYKKLPSTAKLLANMFIERERKCALKHILKSFRPTVSCSLLTDALAYEDEAACVAHLESLGISVKSAEDGVKHVDCKISLHVNLN